MKLALILMILCTSLDSQNAQATGLEFTPQSSFSDICSIRPFSQGLAAASSCHSQKVGFVDVTGKFVIPTSHRYVGDFSEGLASFDDGGHCGYIDLTGKIKIKPQFGNCSGFHSGLAHIDSSDNSYDQGFVNKSGNVVLRFFMPKAGVETVDSTIVGPFSENLLTFRFGVQPGRSIASLQNMLKPGADFNAVSKYISEFLPVDELNRPVDESGRPNCSAAQQTLTIGTDGKIKMFGKFDHIEPFHHGLAFANQSIVVDDRRCDRKITWSGFISPTGKKLISLAKDEVPVTGFEQGVSVIVKHYSSFGILSEKGEWILKPSLSYLQDFNGGFALASKSPHACKLSGDGRHCVLSRYGGYKSDELFHYFFVNSLGIPISGVIANPLDVSPVVDGIAVMGTSGGDPFNVFIDTHGDEVGPKQFRRFCLLGHGLVAIQYADGLPWIIFSHAIG